MLPLIMPEVEDHIAAGTLRNDCRRRGVQVGTIDALLAVRCTRVLSAGSHSGKVERMAEVKEVLDEALKLAPDERASVAVELLESLEAAPEERADVEAAWAAEIERRARRVLKGDANGAPWDDVRRRAEAKLAKR